MDALFTIFLGLLCIGAITARITGWMMRSWLATNAGWMDSAGQRVLRYFFGIFVDIGTASTFMEQKKVRSEPPTLAYVFFSSFGATMLGLLGLFGAMAAH
jgi:hypothetical protein